MTDNYEVGIPILFPELPSLNAIFITNHCVEWAKNCFQVFVLVFMVLVSMSLVLLYDYTVSKVDNFSFLGLKVAQLFLKRSESLY